MLKEEDVTIRCRQCGKEFLFTKAEQEFYKEKGFNTPRRCKECRTTETIQPGHLNCSQCGTEVDEGIPVYCDTCLNNTALEAELKSKNIQEELKQAYTKLKAMESENAELKESLDHEKTLIGELEQNVSTLSQDLEEFNQLQSTLSEWFEPTLSEIEKKLEDRLECLEQGQNRINERMLQLIEKIHEMHENTTLLEIIKQSFKHHQKPDKQPI